MGRPVAERYRIIFKVDVANEDVVVAAAGATDIGVRGGRVYENVPIVVRIPDELRLRAQIAVVGNLIWERLERGNIH